MSQPPPLNTPEVLEIESTDENNATEAIPRTKANYNQLLSALLISFGGCIMGSILSWTSPVLVLLKDLNNTDVLLHVNDDEGSLISSITAIGALLGALFAGLISGTLGRKLTLLLFSLPWIASYLTILLAKSVSFLYIARFIAGVVIAVISSVIPVYVAEIVNPSNRGQLGTLFELFLTSGILCTNIVGLTKSYRALAIVGLILSCLYFIGLFFIPRSPTELMAMKKEEMAMRVLLTIRGEKHNLKDEMKDIEMEIKEQRKGSLKEVFFGYSRKVLLICLMLRFLMQHCGINAVVFYSVEIFQDVNGLIPPRLSAVIVAFFQVVATIASGLLVDRIGRRVLLLISAFLMSICLGVLGYYFSLKDRGDDVKSINWIPILSVVVFITAFHLGFGPVPWILTGELFAKRVKSHAVGIIGVFHWVQTFISTHFFATILKEFGNAYTYWSFAGVCLFALIFTLFFVPETKGKSLEQIQEELMGKTVTSSPPQVGSDVSTTESTTESATTSL